MWTMWTKLSGHITPAFLDSLLKSPELWGNQEQSSERFFPALFDYFSLQASILLRFDVVLL